MLGAAVATARGQQLVEVGVGGVLDPEQLVTALLLVGREMAASSAVGVWTVPKQLLVRHQVQLVMLT
jgi:hypothetical protein